MSSWSRLALGMSAVALGGCASAVAPTYGPPIGPAPVPTQQTVGVLSSRSVGRLGQVLVNPAGQTIYANAAERTPGAGCDAVCRRTWPLLLAPAAGVAVAQGSAAAGLIGETQLAGQRVLTYAGHVLHIYVGDASAGSAGGQNVQGVWAAVTVTGAPAVGVP